ncbi:MAG TPA: recombination protein O N-terminal domain-containing protein [Candidatus Paceibacterota bacterium]|nr:recombination protein O N-terminal domain-containing protein [Candidatus Paceibacterota bacterium]
MHSIITTEGIVLAKRSAGEATTRVVVFTEALGVVRIAARSARLERSKLRYGLETLTLGRFALVEGRYEWKLTGAQDISRELVPESLAGRRAAGRVVRLLLRLIQGEGTHLELYRTAANGLRALAASPADELEQVEWLLVLRILWHLGYVEQSGALMPFLQNDSYMSEDIERAKVSGHTLLRSINESLSATGL